MNRIVLGFAALAASVCLFVACKKDDPEPTTENQSPSVSIIKPEEEITFEIEGSDTTFAIEVNASDPDGSISKVEFFIDGTKIGEDVSSPYSYSYTFQPDIIYTIKATATDNLGLTSSKQIVELIAIPK